MKIGPDLYLDELALINARLNIDLAMTRAQVRVLTERVAELEAENPPCEDPDAG